MKSIYERIAVIQQGIGVIKKNAENPHLKSKYADWPAIWSELRPHLLEQKLVLITLYEATAVPDTVRIRVSLRCWDDPQQEISSTVDMPIVKSNPQAVGSSTTYALRYAASKLIGLVVDGEDDDGAAASKGRARAPKASDEAASSDPLAGIL